MGPNGTSIVAFETLSTSQRRGAIVSVAFYRSGVLERERILFQVVAVFALLSALALAFIALRTMRLAMMLFPECDDGTARPPEILFFRTQLGHYAGCLVLSNMFISASGLINFSWVSRSGLSPGSTCSAQGEIHSRGPKHPTLKT
ncbi:hypothetical protein J3R82DRAFT_11445 [Butyriboletus roseoflavus]|nr:hypothetical protein J3R82DRAFT_11445 [Butyriboletus roseoflavus]